MINITKNNEGFEKLSNPEKRVIIATDVLKAIESKDMIASNLGVYLATREGYEKDSGRTLSNYNDPVLLELANNIPDGSFQDQIPNLPVCQVCAKGAIFLCTVAKANKVKNRNITGIQVFQSENLSTLLGDIFEFDQLEAIEGAFECWNEFEDDLINYHRKPKERMIIIMKNIIRNNGTFIATQDFEVNKDY